MVHCRVFPEAMRTEEEWHWNRKRRRREKRTLVLGSTVVRFVVHSARDVAMRPKFVRSFCVLLHEKDEAFFASFHFVRLTRRIGQTRRHVGRRIHFVRFVCCSLFTVAFARQFRQRFVVRRKITERIKNLSFANDRVDQACVAWGRKGIRTKTKQRGVSLPSNWYWIKLLNASRRKKTKWWWSGVARRNQGELKA